MQTLAERTDSVGGNGTSRPDNDTPFTGLRRRSPDVGQVRLLRQKPRRKPSSADGSFPSLILMQQPDTRCLRVPERLLPPWFPSATYHLLLPTFLGSLGEAPGEVHPGKEAKENHSLLYSNHRYLPDARSCARFWGCKNVRVSLAELLSTYLPLWLLRAQFWSKARVQTNTQENHRRRQNTCKL